VNNAVIVYLIKNLIMKNLFFAGSFAVASFLAFGFNHSGINLGATQSVGTNAAYDTLPRSKKDSLKKKKNWGKDSTMRKDTSNPQRDTTRQQ
jgi:hypothetical protein